MIALLAALALAAPCPEDASAEAVVRTLEAAEALFATMDVDGFVARTDALSGMLPCVDAPLSSTTVARLHRVHGIRAFVDRDSTASVRAFAAARSLEPDYRFGEALVPPNHPLRKDYLALDPAGIATAPAPRPKQGRVTFDGRDTFARPLEVPTYLQRLDRGGGVLESGYLLPGEPLPAYPARKPPHPLQRPLMAITGSAAVATAAMFTGAAVSRGAYDRLPLDTAEGQDRLDPLRRQTHGLLMASAVAGGLTVGGGAGLVAVLVR